MSDGSRYCTHCGQSELEVGPLSARAVCAGCGDAAMRSNSEQMRERAGPYYDRWVSRWAQAAAAELLRIRTRS